MGAMKGDLGQTATVLAQRSLRLEEYQRLLCAYYEAMEPFIKQAMVFRALTPSRFFEQRLHGLVKLTAVQIFGRAPREEL